MLTKTFLSLERKHHSNNDMGDFDARGKRTLDEKYVRAWETLEQHFLVRPCMLTSYDDDKAVETFHRTLLYVVSPLFFGRDYSNELLSKAAEIVRLQRTGPFDAAKHSTSAERRILQLTKNAVKMLFEINKLRLSKAGEVDFSNVLNMKNPRYLLHFAREQIIAINVPSECVNNDESTLLFIVAFLIVHVNSFQAEILQELTRVEEEHAEEVDRLFLAGSSAHMQGNHAEVIRLAEEGLKLNPFSSAMFSNLWCAYVALAQPEYACWCAARAVLLSPDVGLGYLQWILSAQALGNIEVASQASQAMFSSGIIDQVYLDDVCYQEFAKLNLRLTAKGGYLRSDTFPNAHHIDWKTYFKENDTKRKASIKLALSISPSNGIANIFFEHGRFLILPVSPNSYHESVTKKSINPFRYLVHIPTGIHVAFKDSYGFVPFQWITVFPHDLNEEYGSRENIILNAWFIAVISPIAFGFNFSHPTLANWAESLGILSNIPSESDQVTSAAELEILKLVFQVHNFIISDMDRLLITDEDLCKLGEMSNPIAYGRRLLLKTLGDTVTCVNDDKVVLLFLAFLLIGTSARWSKLAWKYTYMYGHGKLSSVFLLRNSAKAAISHGNYSKALKLYRQALVLSPLDSVMFINIADVYIQMKKYDLARWFALRAVWLNPNQPKNHYCWCQATALSGRVHEALAVNDAILSCVAKSNDADRNPIWNKIYSQREFILGLKCAESNNNDETVDKSKRRCYSARERNDVKCNERSSTKIVGRLADAAVILASSAQQKDVKRKDIEADNLLRENHVTINSSSSSAVRIHEVSVSVCSESGESNLSVFTDYLRNGSKQLVDNLFKPAMESYGAAMEILRKTSRMELCLTEMDEALIKYCYAKALMRRHTYEHIWKAIEIFDEILHEHNIPFPMAYYGKGLAYFLLNRFTDAIEPLQKALDIVEKTGVHLEIHVHPGLPDKLVNESCRNNLREAVLDLLDNCHSPPSPDATCHANNSEYDADSNHMAKIYSNDPEFQGYVRATCRERCHIEFHPRCFKKIAEEFKIHGDKAVIGHRCLTPDCESVFVKFEIFGSDGLVRKTLDEQVEVNVKMSNAPAKNKNKLVIFRHNESTKKGFKKRLRTQSTNSDTGRDKEVKFQAQLKRERSRSIECKMGTAVASSPDMRSAENALRILNKFDSDTNESPKKFAARKRPALAESRFTPIEINCADPHGRIEILQAERQAVEMGPFGRVRLNSDSPFSNPFESQTEFSFLDDYLQQSVEESRLSNMIEISSSENVGQMTTVIDFVKEFIEANGPISMSSPQFLDFINCIPIELQELISRQENGILGLLKWTTTLFIGDIAFTREKLVTALSGDSTSVNSGLDLAVPAFRRANKSFCFKNKGNLRRIESSPCFLILSQEVVESDHATKVSDYEEDVSSDGSEYYDDSEEEESKNVVATNDTLASVLVGKNHLLSEQLQSYRDKLFAAQKQTNFERKAKLEEMENSGTIERELKETKINFHHVSRNLEEEIKLLKNRLTAQSQEKRSIDEERRKCSDLQSEVAVLEMNLAAMELNHCSVVTKNRALKDRLLVLESELARKAIMTEEMTINLQTMAARVDEVNAFQRNFTLSDDSVAAVVSENHELKNRLLILENELVAKTVGMEMTDRMYDMAAKMNNRVCAEGVDSTGGVSDFRNIPSLTNPISPVMGAVKNACMQPMMGEYVCYPPQFAEACRSLPYLSFMQPNLVSTANPISPSLIPTVPNGKVPLLPTPAMPPTSLNEFSTPDSSPKANESASNFTNVGATLPKCGSNIFTSAGTSGGIKAGKPEAGSRKADKACGISPAPLPRRCSDLVDSYSEGGWSCDSNVNDFLLPYGWKSKRKIVCIKTAETRTIPCRSKLAVNHSSCRFPTIYTYLHKEFPGLTKIQFLTYFELVRSKRKGGSLTGCRLKNIAELVRMEALHYLPPQARPKIFPIPKLDGPSFWSDGPGVVETCKKNSGKKPSSKKVIVSDDVCAICLMEIEEMDAHYLRCPGRHCYHSKCIRRWYSTGNTSCPTCCMKVPLHEDFPTLRN